MAKVTVTIPSSVYTVGPNEFGWNILTTSQRPSMGTELSASGEEIWLGQFFIGRVSNPPLVGRIRLRFANPQDENPSFLGEDLSDQMEMNGTITLRDSAGNEVEIDGIGDSTEPYTWFPSNATAIRDFGTTLNSLTDKSLTLTFNDNATNLFERVNGVYVPVDLFERVGGSYVQADLLERVSGVYKR